VTVDDALTASGSDGSWDADAEPPAPEQTAPEQTDRADEDQGEVLVLAGDETAEGPAGEPDTAAASADGAGRHENDERKQAAAAPPVTLMTDFGIDGGNLDGYDPAATDGFAPKPTFDHKVNYTLWYQQYALGHPEDNAAELYAAFMPQPGDGPGDKPVWPEFHDMYHDPDFEGPPVPWDPKDHPEWEATSEAAADLFEKYRAAAQHRGYAIKFVTEYNPDASSTDADNTLNADEKDLLIGILLPNLSSHRTLAKAMLADAWRAPNGKVSAERMHTTIDTALRAANHMYQGSTLIEDLVGIAIARLANINARWALKRGVFSPDEMKDMLDSLQARDNPPRALSDILGGEHAFAMDFAQHLFTPPTANGEPHFNHRRTERAMAWWNEPDKVPALVERISHMTPDDVYTSLAVLDNYYRELGEMMQIGYPTVHAEDIDALQHRATHASALTESILPGLSRYYELTVRSVADRRATQVAFATEVFNAEHGRYPTSLDELPVGDDGTMTIDPFTGEPFGYKLTESGPRIYSLSENGIDDGGSHSPRWGDRGGNEAGSDDYVFWPPQP